MEGLKRSSAHKQTFVVVGMLGALLISFIAASSSTSYLYRSRADESPQMLQTKQESTAVVNVDVDEYRCVKSLTYLPNNQQLGCFAQIECADVTNTNIPDMCQDAQGIISCTLNSDSCMSAQQWLEKSAHVCGCA